MLNDLDDAIIWDDSLIGDLIERTTFREDVQERLRGFDSHVAGRWETVWIAGGDIFESASRSCLHHSPSLLP